MTLDTDARYHDKLPQNSVFVSFAAPSIDKVLLFVKGMEKTAKGKDENSDVFIVKPVRILEIFERHIAIARLPSAYTSS